MTLDPPPSYRASDLPTHDQYGRTDDLPRYDHTSSLDVNEKEKETAKDGDSAKVNGLSRIRSALSRVDSSGSGSGSDSGSGSGFGSGTGTGTGTASKGWLWRKKEEMDQRKEEREQRKAKKIEEEIAEGKAMLERVQARVDAQRDSRQKQIDDWVLKRAEYGESIAGPAPIPYFKDKNGSLRASVGRAAMGAGMGAGLGAGAAMIYTGGDFSGFSGGGGFGGGCDSGGGGGGGGF